MNGVRGPKVVAFGGGHGLSATLAALRHVTSNLTAVVTVADDGGSSGRLRTELGVLPPGDLRMALSALCDDGEWGLLWRDDMQHRFHTDGPLNGHSTGNLLIATLWNLLGNSVEGLDLVGRLLGIRGRVLPMTSVPLEIEADVHHENESKVVRGQVAVASAPGRVESIRLFPEDAPAQPEAVQAIDEADWLIFGPGSWFTSVLPHLMVRELHEAISRSSARKVLTLNLVNDSETSGMTHADLLNTFHSHGLDVQIDVILADPSAVVDIDQLSDAAEALGATLIFRQVRRKDDPSCHDALRYAAALRDAFEGTFGDISGGPASDL